MLRIEHLTKNYGEKKAVDDLNLHIAPGEIYGFIGHNGAGKTTTLKSVAGILQFDAGQIYPDAAVGMQAQLCLYENSEYHPEIGKVWNDFEQNRLRLQRDRRCWFRCRDHQYGFGCRYGAELREYTQTA